MKSQSVQTVQLRYGGHPRGKFEYVDMLLNPTLAIHYVYQHYFQRGVMADPEQLIGKTFAAVLVKPGRGVRRPYKAIFLKHGETSFKK